MFFLAIRLTRAIRPTPRLDRIIGLGKCVNRAFSSLYNPHKFMNESCPKESSIWELSGFN